MRIPSIRPRITWRAAGDGPSHAIGGLDASRRQALKNAAALTVGAVGMTIAHAGAGLGNLVDRSRPVAVPPGAALGPPAASTTTFVLIGRDVHLVGKPQRAGILPAEGERGTVTGDLFKSVEGDPVGRFQAASFFGDERASGLEVHAFELPGGMLLGLGTAAFGEGTFAVVGGTGRFAGAGGSYTAAQRIREIGGDGSAEFTFTLTGGMTDGE